jgi:hypothetical protein
MTTTKIINPLEELLRIPKPDVGAIDMGTDILGLMIRYHRISNGKGPLVYEKLFNRIHENIFSSNPPSIMEPKHSELNAFEIQEAERIRTILAPALLETKLTDGRLGPWRKKVERLVGNHSGHFKFESEKDKSLFQSFCASFLQIFYDDELIHDMLADYDRPKVLAQGNMTFLGFAKDMKFQRLNPHVVTALFRSDGNELVVAKFGMAGLTAEPVIRELMCIPGIKFRLVGNKAIYHTFEGRHYKMIYVHDIEVVK